MRRKATIGLGAALLAAIAWAQQAVLYIGSDWDNASAKAKAAWDAPGFASRVGVPLATVDDPEVVTDAVKAQWERQKAIRLEPRRYPAVAYFDKAGDCLLLREGVADAEPLAAAVADGRALDATAAKAVAAGDAEAIGAALAQVAQTVGEHQKRAKALWAALKKADPEDKTGWAFALTFDPARDACYKVQDFLKAKDIAGAEAYIKGVEAKPQAHLSVNQKQGLALLRYVLYRNDKSKRAEMTKLLRRVLKMGRGTHFGIAAQGLLCLRGEGPVAVPYGWWGKHAKAGKQTWEIPVGVAKTIVRPGRYELTFARDKRAQGAMTVARVVAIGAEGPVSDEAPLAGPVAVKPGESASVPFVCAGAARALRVTVAFEKPAAKERGSLALREILPERAAVDNGFDWAAAGPSGDYLKAVVPRATIEAIAHRAGGVDFLKAFVADEAWREDFCGSGDPLTGWGEALEALDIICHVYPQVLGDATLRRWAAAAALNAGKDPTDCVLLFGVFLDLRAAGGLVIGADAMRCDQMRFTLIPAQCNAESARWLAARHNVPPRRYGGVCWAAPYRLNNFFGDSIHGRDYYKAWDHAYVRHENSRLVGGVCGALSYYGSAAAKVRGVPSTPGGQPGHCAYTVWSPSQGRWTLAYNIAPYTGPHFLLWGGRGRFAYQELAARAFAEPGMRDSMRWLWKAETFRLNKGNALDIATAYRAAAKACPTNFAVWRAWGDFLRETKAPAADWRAWGDACAKGLGGHVEPAWDLLLDYPAPALRQAGAAPLREALVAWCGTIRQGDWQTAEFGNYQGCLERLAKTLGDDREGLFACFAAALKAQLGTPDAFGRLMRWGGAAFLGDDAFAKRYVAAIEGLLKDTGADGNALGKYIREAIREASSAGNPEAFHALCDLQDALAPTNRAYLDAKLPGTLLSARGLLRLSSTSSWDHPEAYRAVIDGLTPAGNFHTSNEKTPWAEVVLPGMAEVSGVWLMNRGDQNNGRLPPFAIEISEDGKTWREVARDDQTRDTYTFTFAPAKAKHVRVICHPKDKTYLHLRKFCVFGKKLY